MKTRGHNIFARLLRKEGVRRLLAAALFAAPLLSSAPARAVNLYPGNGAAMSTPSADLFLPSAELAAQCGVIKTVKFGGGADYSNISGAIASLNLAGSISTNTCVVVLDNSVYTESVLVQGIATNGYRLRIMADPAFTGGAPQVRDSGSGYSFSIQNDSVTLQGIDISPLNTFTYGVRFLNSAFCELSESTITLAASTYAGIYFSGASSNTVSDVYVSNPNGDAVTMLGGSNLNSISSSTLLADGFEKSVLYIEYSSSNTVSYSFLSNPSSFGPHFKGGGYNTVRFSTITGNSSTYAPVMFDAEAGTMNGIEDSYVFNALGNAVDLGSNGFIGRSAITGGGAAGYAVRFSGTYSQVSDSIILSTTSTAIIFASGNNTINRSTVTSRSAAGYAVQFMGSSNSQVLDSYIYNVYGTAIYLQAGSGYNTISGSTVTANAAGKYAVYGDNSGNNTITRSFIYNPAGTAVFLSNFGSANSISYSTITTSAANYTALNITDAGNTRVVSSYLQGAAALV